MYLISLYFDEKTNKKLNEYVQKIANVTGNNFLLENEVPPHITIAAIETKKIENILMSMTQLESVLTGGGKIDIVSIGILLPYVIYAAPVLNQYLQIISEEIYQSLSMHQEVKISKYYQPFHWLPHITLAKKLEQVQMQSAFSCMQKHFIPIQASIEKIGLAKANPYEDIWSYHLL